MKGFDLALLAEWMPSLLEGLGVTVMFTIGSLVLGLVIGLVVAIAGLTRFALLRGLARVYVDVIRGTPLLLQLFLLYYAAPSFGLRPSAVTAGILGLGINSGAYLAEIFRAGIEAVPRPHVHAARSLGLSYRQTLMRIELPQAVGMVLPPMAGEMINLLKSTSLLSTIAIGDLLRSGQIAVSVTFAPLEIYAAVGLLYLAVNTALSGLVRMLEARTGSRARLEVRRSLREVGV